MPTLEELGWNGYFAAQLAAAPAERDGTALFPARVVEEQKRYYRLATERGECWGELIGKFLHAAETRAHLPAVGDWVLASAAPGAERASIHRLLERKSKLSRRAAGDSGQEQLIAANVDVVFIAESLSQPTNLSRFGRYLAVVRASGAKPVVLLTKADLCPDVAAREREIAAAAGGAPVHAVSVTAGKGLEEVLGHLAPGLTTAVVGPSGVGKSTLINWLAGEALQQTSDVRGDDDKGRHTTTYRRLLQLGPRGLVIDTPGMREMHVWIDAGSADAFDDVLELSLRCKFSNCAHETEPGCAVKAAVADGRLEQGRYQAFLSRPREAPRPPGRRR